MQANSKPIISNQAGPHDRLEETVLKHTKTPFLKPVAEHTQQVFNTVSKQLLTVRRPLIFDGCCGVGDSSRELARQNPDHWVVGVDKSENRLSRERAGEVPSNLILARADLNDFYRLASVAGWEFEKHYILYPNPWPKSSHFGRRWHGAPVFPAILKLGGVLELRSNWKLYLEEFSIALQLLGYESELSHFVPDTFLTPFEQKYHQSGQPLWRLVSTLE